MMPVEAPTEPYSEAQLGAAWIAVIEECHAKRAANQQAIDALAREIYLSPDARSERGAQLLRERTQIDNSLIELGQVLERCRQMYPKPPQDPGEDGLNA